VKSLSPEEGLSFAFVQVGGICTFSQIDESDGFYVQESSAHMWEHVCVLPRAEITVSSACEAVQEAVC